MNQLRAFSRLREKIAANRELAAQLEAQLNTLEPGEGRPAGVRRPKRRPAASRSRLPTAAARIEQVRPFQSIRNWYRNWVAPNGGAPVSRRDIPADFDEDAYLFLNPDVASAVESGSMASGYAHWLATGRREGRGGGPWEPLSDRSEFLELLESRPYGVNLIGFLSTVSGVGASTRSFAQALEAAGIPFQGISIPSWEERGAERPIAKYEPYRVNLLVQNPDMLPRFVQAYGSEMLQGCYNIGYWA